MMTDTIADMLTRIRNGNQIRAEKVDIPYSKIKLEILKSMKDENYIKGYKLIKEGKKTTLRVTLRYLENGDRVLTGLKRISKPSRRLYVGKDNIPSVMNGLGIAVLSTSQKILTDAKCREKGIGGEVLCYIW
jgi:small subunit ribosomal protein S8